MSMKVLIIGFTLAKGEFCMTNIYFLKLQSLEKDMKFKLTLISILAGCLAMGAQAIEFRSADTHNADDYPTVVAVKHMSEVLEK